MKPEHSVSIQVSDPWDVVTDTGDAPLAGRLCSLAPRAAFVRLDFALLIRGKTVSVISATPRDASENFTRTEGPVAVNLTLLTTDESPAFAAIGTLIRA